MLHLRPPFALVHNAFSILMLAVLDRALLAGGPLLFTSGCLSSVPRELFSVLLSP